MSKGFMINPQLSLDQFQQARFEKILQTVDFTICDSDYDVARVMFKRMDAVIKKYKDENEKFSKKLEKACKRIGISREALDRLEEDTELGMGSEGSEVDKRTE